VRAPEAVQIALFLVRNDPTLTEELRRLQCQN